jgi:tagatose-1,6-bisphosphate aldolase
MTAHTASPEQGSSTTSAHDRIDLSAIATTDNTFAIVAMDQRNTLKRMYHAAGIPDPTLEELTEIKADTVQALRGTGSGFLLDPSFGIPALAELPVDGPSFGVLVAAEPSDRGNVNGEPRTHRDPALDAEWVRRQGGHAVKFLVQLRADRKPGPDGIDTTAEVLEVVRQVVADCRAVGIPSVIENLIYPLHGEAPATPQERADRIIEAAIALDELKPDLIKLEYPGDAASCKRLADSLTVPWAVLSAGVGFDEFAAALRIACDDGGTSGFIAGRSIWKEAVGMDRRTRQAFLGDVGKRRLDNLVQVIDGRARPYTEVTAR